MSISLIQVCGGGRDLNLALDGWLIYSARLLTLWEKIFKLFKKSFRAGNFNFANQFILQIFIRIILSGICCCVLFVHQSQSFIRSSHMWRIPCCHLKLPPGYCSCFESQEHINIESVLASYNLICFQIVKQLGHLYQAVIHQLPIIIGHLLGNC